MIRSIPFTENNPIFERVKASGFNRSKVGPCCNMDPLSIVESRELSRSSNMGLFSVNGIAFIILCLFVSCAQPVQIFGWVRTLSERASNPITNLSQLQFENDYTSDNYGTKDPENVLSIKPLIAIDKTSSFPFEQLIRVKLLVPTLPSSPKTVKGTSLGDTQFFDLFVTEEPAWGRWGVGPMAILPTATTLDAGQGKWQIGPAIGLSVLKFPNWQFGFLAQNPISFAGNSHKPKQNYLLFQPFATYHFLKNSYIMSNGEWTVDWLNHNLQIPINIGLGHTIEEIKMDILFQYQWMAYQNAVKSAGFVNHSTWQLSISVLLN